MALLSTKMSLRLWTDLNDLYSHDQLADNFSKLDFHDHSPGRGNQIPTEGIFDGAVTGAKLDTTVLAGWRSIAFGTAFTTSQIVVGTGFLTIGGGFGISTALSVNSNVFYLDPADYAVPGKTTEFRIRGIGLISAAAAPGANISFMAIPITAVAGTGGTLSTTSGTAAGTVTMTAPTASSRNVVTSAVITPATLTAGYYSLAAQFSATTASTAQFYRAELQVHNI